MRKGYVVVPAHVVAGYELHDSAEEAAVAASHSVAGDKTPRVVVELHHEVRASHEPRVDIVRLQAGGQP